MKKLLFLLFFTLALLFSTEKGSINLFVFFNGKPYTDMPITIDEKITYSTDEKGAIKVYLDEGAHSAKLIKDSLSIGFFKFNIYGEENTQAIITLTEDNPKIDIEEPKNAKTQEEKLSNIENKKLAKGYLIGNIVSSEKKEPIAGAKIFVRGFSQEGLSDKNGLFSLELPEGNYSLSAIHQSFATQTVDNITIVANESLNKIIEMTPAGLELEEFVVLAPYIQGSLASVMAEEKKSNAIANILSSEEFSKKGDGDAAAALKRVTGVTLIGGKSVFVRGLGERYSSVEMNSMPLPSPDPTKRTVPLDIFPSSVIGSLKVQKSSTADIPAGFGGGYIDIRTKESSKNNSAKVSFGLSGNSFTGKKTDTYQGGSTDWLGYDDGYREIDPLILNNLSVNVGSKPPAATTTYFTKEELSEMTQSYINRDFATHKESLPMGYNASLEIEKNYSDNLSLAFNYGYSQSHNYKDEDYYSYEINPVTDKLYKNPDQEGSITQTSSEFSHGGILNAGFAYSDSLKLKFTSLYTLNSQKSTRIADGIMGSNDSHFRKYYLDWEERELLVNQFSGTKEYQFLGKDSIFDFGAEVASANLYQPNNYYYAYINYDGVYKIDVESGNNHIAQKLESQDDLTAYFFKNRWKYGFFDKENYLEVGYSSSNKERESRQSKYYLRKMGSAVEGTDQDIDTYYDETVASDIDYDDRGYIVSPLFKAADSFDANIKESAYYINTFTKPTENLGVMVGVRFVDFSQTLWQFLTDRTNPDMSLRGLIIKEQESLKLNDSFPSLSLKYSADDKNIVDFAISKTYVVPDLREFSSGEYFHPYDVATVVGNPELENTDITSVDLQYTHYFSTMENIKLGVFYKFLDKPIEDVMLPSSSLPTYGYKNTDSATLQGFEVDGRKNLSMINEEFEPFYIAGNFSYTDSLVKLTKEQKEIFTSNNRELQGLSKTVINATIGYEENKESIVLTYNKMGKRIRKVGLIDDVYKYPNHYEIPPELLDLIYGKKLKNGVELKLKIQNILDSKTVWTQGDNTTKEFKTGQNYSVSVGYSF